MGEARLCHLITDDSHISKTRQTIVDIQDEGQLCELFNALSYNLLHEINYCLSLYSLQHQLCE